MTNLQRAQSSKIEIGDSKHSYSEAEKQGIYLNEHFN